jgi:hypothetical protein
MSPEFDESESVVPSIPVQSTKPALAQTLQLGWHSEPLIRAVRYSSGRGIEKGVPDVREANLLEVCGALCVRCSDDGLFRR